MIKKPLRIHAKSLSDALAPSKHKSAGLRWLCEASAFISVLPIASFLPERLPLSRINFIIRSPTVRIFRSPTPVRDAKVGLHLANNWTLPRVSLYVQICLLSSETHFPENSKSRPKALWDLATWVFHNSAKYAQQRVKKPAARFYQSKFERNHLGSHVPFRGFFGLMDTSEVSDFPESTKVLSLWVLL